MIGYLEVHIEQGPVLEHEGLSLGVVTAIAGQSRFRVTWTGKASHAGTTPPSLRRDALSGAAAFIREVEEASAKFDGLMATVGQLQVEPNVTNVVPERVLHSLDVRHQEDSVRNEACAWLAQRASELATVRRLALDWETLPATEAKKCDTKLSRRLLDAVEICHRVGAPTTEWCRPRCGDPRFAVSGGDVICALPRWTKSSSGRVCFVGRHPCSASGDGRISEFVGVDMTLYDVLFCGGTVVTPESLFPADIAVVEGRIVAVRSKLERSAAEIVDASGLYLFPGIIDAHIHFNEPGREHWEGLASGSRSLAAGGGALFFDMPLNSAPPTLDREGFARKEACAKEKSVLDFALWGGLTPDNLDTMEEMADAGAIGFKAFMSRSGTSDFSHSDARVLKRGMKIAAACGLPVGVHAEDDEMTQALAEERRGQGKISWRDYLDSRPVEAELRAIQVALELAGETGCDLHIVHVSCPEGIDLIQECSGTRRSCDRRNLPALLVVD